MVFFSFCSYTLNLTYSIGQAQAEIIVGDLPTLTANRLVISQVFQNLIGNSIHYRHPNRAPRIRVDFNYRPKENDWLCSVRDNGRGFDDTQKERIFGIFQRLDTDRKGTGMGLAICKRIIEKQGGKIWAESVEGKGSIFSFSFPIWDKTNVFTEGVLTEEILQEELV